MFSKRKHATQTSATDTCDPSAPIPSAIVVTAAVIERKLNLGLHWADEARSALDDGDFNRYNGFICLARDTTAEAVALMESASLLYEEILNRK